MTRLRTLGVWLAAVGLVAGLAGCLPPPVRPTLLVNSVASGDDVVPGDGVCEVTVGVGDCTLPAAVDEANALGLADIDLPAATYAIPGTLTVTGGIRINPDQPGRNVQLSTVINVAPSGTLVLDGLQGGSYLNIVVGGHLIVRRSFIFPVSPVSDATIDVQPGAIALIDNSVIVGYGALDPIGTITNAGLTIIRHSEIAQVDGHVLSTTGTGVTHLSSSILNASVFRRDPQPVCFGTAPTSGGYNVSRDATCALTAPGDLQNTLATYEPGGGVPDATPAADSATLDHIPLGQNGCGTSVTEDILRRPRPVDGDGDGTAACDTGPGERPAPSSG